MEKLVLRPAKPDGLYPTEPAAQGNKPAKLKAIAAALKGGDQVIITTDCDREGQFIGQEILGHLRYRGTGRRLSGTFPSVTPPHDPVQRKQTGPKTQYGIGQYIA